MSEDLTKKQPQNTDDKLDLILTTVQVLTDRVESAESLRPLLHKLVDDVAHLREGQIEGRTDILQLHEGQRALSTEVRALRRDVDHQFGNLYGKLVDIEIDHRDIHDRVTRLELNSNPPNSQT